MISRHWLRRISPNNLKITPRRKFTNGSSNDGYIIQSCVPPVTIPNVTLPEFLNPYLDKFEQYTAIECAMTKRSYTYGDIRTKSTNLAKVLRKKMKLNDGDVVAIILTNVPEYPIANIGVLKANLVVTTVSPLFTSDEIYRQLLDSEAKVVITEVNLTPTVKRAIRMLHEKLPLLVLSIKTKSVQDLPEDVIDFHQLVNTKIYYPDITPCSQNEVALLPYSSGTTGLPKGVQLTHKNLVANQLQNNHPELTFKYEANGNFQEILPVVIPLYHLYGYAVVMNDSIMYGGKIITTPNLRADLYISTLKENQDSTILFLVPPLMLMLTNRDDVKSEYLRKLRAVFCGAAPSAASDENRFREKFGDHIKILQGYGLTETSPIITTLYPKFMESSTKEAYTGSIGKVIPNTSLKVVKVNDPTYTPLPPNTSGELLIKGPQVMKGYNKLPEESEKMLTEDGWLRTGDIGHYNEEGFIFISDRFKELIKVKGSQVAPAELEAIIRSFPEVVDTAVIGIPHHNDGEIPRAYVVVKDKQKFDTKKLDEYVTKKVAKYKRLRGGIVVMDENPRSGAGKILRRKIKENFLEKGI